jgi:hypothetical protein
VCAREEPTLPDLMENARLAAERKVARAETLAFAESLPDRERETVSELVEQLGARLMGAS